MSRGALAGKALLVALSVAVIASLSAAVLLAYRRPDHVMQWLALLRLCGP
jgi:hypothetical protein